MFARLRHWTISSRDHQNSTIHLCRTRNHVFNVISMTRAIDMSIVTFISFILNMCCRNRDTARTFLRRSINLIIRLKLCPPSLCKRFCNRRCKRSFPMVNVTNRTNVTMRFCPLKLSFCHCLLLTYPDI